MFTPFFSISSSPSSGSARIAVVVSKKMAKTAAKRNDVRRKVYGRIGPLYSDLKPFNIVITPQKSSLKLANSDFTSELEGALAKASLLK